MNQIKSVVKLFLKALGWSTIRIVRIGKLLRLRLPLKLLVFAHLLRSGNPGHPNTKAFIKVLQNFDGGALRIVETGTSAWGADSTRLWDEYVRYAGGEVKSVDIRPDPSVELRGKLSKNTQLTVGDSIEFLKGLTGKPATVDLIYLDSIDVDGGNPEPAENHGEAEFKIAMTLVRVGGIILIDDTPTASALLRNRILLNVELNPSLQTVRGKGARVLWSIENNPNFSIYYHDYALALQRIR